jgi:hypothetical protein
MGGLYDLLETYRIQNDPRFAYEGLYQDPMKPKNNVYDYFTYNPDASPYGGATMYVDNLQPFMSSSFPQEFGVGSLFNPRVGRPEQSLLYNEPEPADPTSDFYQPIGDPFQTDYPITRTIQEDEDEDEDQMIQEITAPYTGVTGIGYQTPRTIADQNRILGQTFTPQPKSFRDSATLQEYFENRNPVTGIMNLLSKLPTPMNILRGGLQSLQGFNQRLRATDFGQSQNLMEYLGKRRARKEAERLAPIQRQLQEASERGGGYQPTSRAQNVARTESRVSGGKSKAYGL